MAFFLLIPIFWLTALFIYAASQRQQIKHPLNQALVPRPLAWCVFIVVNIASYFWLTSTAWSVSVSLISLLLINSLLLPACIILAAHQPQRLTLNSFLIVIVSIFFQLGAEELTHVA